MKAAILEGYNKKGCEIKVTDVAMPECSDDEILVRIHTAGVNPLDNMIIRGEVKMIVPYKFPLVMGNEFVGIVEDTGSKATRFSKGD
ncbi:MAG: alcohol dehydrogenase catalytic domain-containing protein, partial [Mogibacterium sp.]|nr:alcohol dehydrogenase catalytic domain-containing protein [Mogibacterium sp.]